MKTSIALLALLLLQAQVPAASPAGATVGTILTVAGKITGVNPNTATISVSTGDSYVVTSTSAVTVDGKRGGISDLVAGMKVNGSAEVAQAEKRYAPQKKIIRMLTATTDPAATGRPVATGPMAPPQNGPGMNFPQTPMTEADLVNLTQRLSGTFWSIPNSRVGNGTAAKPWVSLNADGTSTSSESDRPGSWRVVGNLTAQVQYFAGQTLDTERVVFNAALNRGMDGRFGPWGPKVPGAPVTNTLPVVWTLIEAPTAEMLAKVPSRQPPAPTAGPVPTVPAQPTAESQQAASNLVKANHNNLVFVTGKDGAGSGFIANVDGNNYIVTNAHVAAGLNDADFKTLEGTVLPRGAAGVAVGHDIFRLALPAGGAPLEVMRGVDENAGIGDEVVVLGNAEGSGVVNTIMGRIVGIGPNLVEIDAPFVPGNSGSPIIHLKTGKVIGVATYAVIRKYDTATKEKLSAPVVRRFGFRIDSVKIWQPVNWPAFYAQATVIDRIHTLTGALDDFLRDLYENKSHVTVSRHTNPVIKTRIAQWQESKSHKLSVTDRENADANFISFLKVACQADITDAQRYLSYDYFRRNLAEEEGMRGQMSKAFEEIIKDIRE